MKLNAKLEDMLNNKYVYMYKEELEDIKETMNMYFPELVKFLRTDDYGDHFRVWIQN